MKLNFKSFAIVIGSVALAFSCSTDEPETPAPDNKDDNNDPVVGFAVPVLTASPDEVTLSEGSEAAVAFTWTAAAENAEYELYVTAEEDDIFSNCVYQGAELGWNLSHDAAKAIVDDLGLHAGQSAVLKAAVRAVAGDDDDTSDEVKFTVILPDLEVPVAEILYMLGGALGENGWTEAVEFAQSTEGVYKAEDVELMFGRPEDGKGFKFFLDAEKTIFYGQSKADGAAFGDIQIFMPWDEDSQFYPLGYGYESGKYDVEVDASAMKLTLTLKEKVEEIIPPSKYYVLGENLGVDNGWDMTADLELLPVDGEDGIYELANIQLSTSSSFKVYDEDWTEYIRDDSAAEYYTMKLKGAEDGDIRFVPAENAVDFKYGYYKIRVDFNTMTLAVTLVEEIKGVDPSTLLYIVGEGVFGDSCWDLDSGSLQNAMYPIADGVYEGKNIALSADCKFKFDFAGWNPEYIRDAEAADYYTAKLSDNTDTRFVPSENDTNFKAGNYTVTLDINTLKVTLVLE